MTQYHYALQDHLGNTRIVFSDVDGNGSIDPNTEVSQEEHYYPFGMQMTGDWQKGSDYNYLYNGKELQTELDLSLYNYGARFYDPAIGRWTSVDPLADDPDLVSWSPYSYTYNNPILYTDPTGENPILAIPFIIEAIAAATAAATVTTVAVVTVAEEFANSSDSSPSPNDNGLVEIAAEAAAHEMFEQITPAIDGNSNTGIQLMDIEVPEIVSIRKERIESESDLESALNQAEGLEAAEKAAQKEKRGEKQFKIRNGKTKQNVDNALRRHRIGNEEEE